MKSAIITYAACLLSKVINVPCEQASQNSVAVVSVKDVVMTTVWVEKPGADDASIVTCNSWYCKKMVCNGKRGRCHNNKCFCPYEVDLVVEVEKYSASNVNSQKCNPSECRRRCDPSQTPSCFVGSCFCNGKLAPPLIEQATEQDVNTKDVISTPNKSGNRSGPLRTPECAGGLCASSSARSPIEQTTECAGGLCASSSARPPIEQATEQDVNTKDVISTQKKSGNRSGPLRIPECAGGLCASSSARPPIKQATEQDVNTKNVITTQNSDKDDIKIEGARPANQKILNIGGNDGDERTEAKLLGSSSCSNYQCDTMCVIKHEGRGKCDERGLCVCKQNIQFPEAVEQDAIIGSEAQAETLVGGCTSLMCDALCKMQGKGTGRCNSNSECICENQALRTELVEQELAAEEVTATNPYCDIYKCRRLCGPLGFAGCDSWARCTCRPRILEAEDTEIGFTETEVRSSWPLEAEESKNEEYVVNTTGCDWRHCEQLCGRGSWSRCYPDGKCHCKRWGL